MFRNKFIKISGFAFMIMLGLYMATPKIYIQNLFSYKHSIISVETETKLKSQSSDEADFEKYDKPVYFNIFKFIHSFIPLKSDNSK
jgi:hypothetical protein